MLSLRARELTMVIISEMEVIFTVTKSLLNSWRDVVVPRRANVCSWNALALSFHMRNITMTVAKTVAVSSCGW